MGRPKKKAKLILEDDDPERPGIEGLDGVAPDTSDASAREPEFKINAEYARRFEHNKKREEVQQCQ